MGMLRAVCALLIFFTAGLLMETPPLPPDKPIDDTVQNVDICDVLESPDTYDKRILKLTGFGSHGFEDSSFWSPTCNAAKTSIWLEYGGKASTGTMYCCGVAATRTREEAPKVEGLTISLTDDGNFREFDRLLHRGSGSIAHATVIGRFFAGKEEPKGTGRWTGYGHMGCCSLLVIQQVLNVSPENNELDQEFRDDVEEAFFEKLPSYRFREIPTGKELIALQKNAEEGVSTWRFTDHRRVVSERLATIPSFDSKSLRALKTVKRSSGRIIYKLKNGKKSFMIVAVRPYWLSFYSKDKKNVIWTIASLVESPYVRELGDQ